MARDKLLSLDGDAFLSLKDDFDTLLGETLAKMEEQKIDTAEMTVKLKIRLDNLVVTDRECLAYPASREVVKPVFEHKIVSQMKVQDERSGELPGNYELVWNAGSQKYSLRPLDSSQTSLFEDSVPDFEIVTDPSGLITDVIPGSPDGLEMP